MREELGIYQRGERMRLRLLLFEECHNDCPLCVNKNFDLGDLERVHSSKEFKKYSEIILTGGEPMLYPSYVKDIIGWVRKGTDAPIFIYISKLDNIEAVMEIAELVDGVTVTIHQQRWVDDFLRLDEAMRESGRFKNWSGRLKVFEYIDMDTSKAHELWDVRDKEYWIVDCPLPEGEEFKRL